MSARVLKMPVVYSKDELRAKCEQTVREADLKCALFLKESENIVLSIENNRLKIGNESLLKQIRVLEIEKEQLCQDNLNLHKQLFPDREPPF